MILLVYSAALFSRMTEGGQGSERVYRDLSRRGTVRRAVQVGEWEEE